MRGSLVLLVILAQAEAQIVESDLYPRFFLQRTPSMNTSLVQSLPHPSSSITAPARVGPLARGNNNHYAPSLPCCRDRFGEQACQSLSRSQPETFERRCLTDHDFSTLDCCAECRSYVTTHNISAENSRTLLKAPQFCKDKHSLSFCRRFKMSGMGKFSCANAEFAVRVCRHTCGYCNDVLYATSNTTPLCSKTPTKSVLSYSP